MIKRILILGAYGNFGSHITKKLAYEPDLQIIIAGRSEEKCQHLASSFKDAPNPPTYHVLDISKNLPQELKTIAPDIVIHTSGPFQGQGYEVAEACIDYGCHYIDLADGRAFVDGIGCLDQRAKEKNLSIITGASSVPTLTSAIMDHYLPEFQKITSVDYAITTAQHTNTGLATTSAVLSYTGNPFETLINGKMQKIYGWQDLHAYDYPDLGHRLLGNCDIPDLYIFPQRYKDLATIRFYAGLEIRFLHLGLWGISWMVRAGLIKNLERYSDPLLKISRLFDTFGSNQSGFHFEMSGIGKDESLKKKTFYIIAKSGHGPFIPSVPSILCAKILARDETMARGAWPCVGIISLEQYMESLKDLDIKFLTA